MGRKGRVAAFAVGALFVVGLVPLAGEGAPPLPKAAIPPALLEAAQATPTATFRVIVQARPGRHSADVASDVSTSVADNPGSAKGLKRRFVSIAGVSAQLTGRQILFLAKRPNVLAITPDAPLQPAGGPVATAPPSVAGLPQDGQALTVLAGVWAGAGDVSLVYQWQRCNATASVCADIADATGSSYAATSADVGSTLRVAVTGTDAGGSTTVFSTTTAVVAAAPVAPTVVAPTVADDPTITGPAQDGSTLTASSGDWTGASAYTYQWQTCSAADRTTALNAASPLGLWRFDDGASTATDATGHGLSGTYGGTAAAAGGALSLDGGGAVDIAGLPSGVFAKGFTLEARVKVDQSETNVGVVSKWAAWGGAGVMLWIDESGHYALVVTRDAHNYLTTDAAPTVGKWEHIAATWDGSTLRLYRDGVEIGSRPFAGDPGEPTSDLLIGDYDGSGHKLTGSIDDVAVYDRALSPDEVSDHAAGCRDIPGATDPTISVGQSLIGDPVRVVVAASGAGGTAAAASVPTDPITAVAPTALERPTVSGVPSTGRRLTGTEGVWVGTKPITLEYQWQRCDASSVCTDIVDADQLSYTTRPSDAGNTLQLEVTATGPGGTTTVTSLPLDATAYSNAQVWPYAMGIDHVWPATVADDPNAPAIAIIDSGIDSTRADFGDRVVKEVTLTSLTPNSPGDGRGHGTFVASVAAGGGSSYAGAAPNARIVSLDVMDDQGMAMTSDVIAAADWIEQNKDTYGIKVANLSLQESAPSSIQYDPLDKAVEKLWLSGVTVVTASGNFATDGAESGEPYAPGNDPFVISVGASDVAGTVSAADDVAAPWSAWGHTGDGFAKPEVGAPGRYIVGAVPPDSTLAQEHPDQLIDGTYLQLSGTSFSSAAVAGAVADLLEAHPDWTPDQVKGALMMTAMPTSAAPRSLGVGEVSVAAAAALSNPPNANAALAPYVVSDPAGGSIPVFDAASWGAAAAADPSWATASWGAASWGAASWGAASWGASYWEAQPVPSDPTGSADGNAASDNAADDFLPAGGYWISPRG